MKRKVYESEYDRRSDRRIGAVAFVVVNGLVWLLYQWLSQRAAANLQLSALPYSRLPIAIQLIPWVANGIVLALTLIFRPEIAIGYLGIFGGILLLGGMLAAVTVISCIVSIPVMFISPQLGLVIWIILLVVGVAFFGFKLVILLLSKL